MRFEEGPDIFEPHLADMRGEPGPNEPPEIVDGLARLGLAKSVKRCPARGRPIDAYFPFAALVRAAANCVESWSVRRGPHRPLAMKAFEPDLLLRAAGFEEGSRACRLPLEAMILGVGVDLFGAPRHVGDHVLRYAAYLEEPPPRVEVDIISESAQAMREIVAVDLPGGHLLGEHGAGFEADHLFIPRVPGHVENDDMGVEMGVELAGGMFGEARVEKLAGRLVDDVAVHAAAKRGIFLDPADRSTHRFLMGCNDTLVARDQRHDRHRFRRVDREVPAGMMLDGAMAATAEMLLADLAGEQHLERPALDRTFEPEFGSDPPAPCRGLVPSLRIIVADGVIAGDISGRAPEAARMDHAGFAGLRRPPGRPCWRSECVHGVAMISRRAIGASGSCPPIPPAGSIGAFPSPLSPSPAVATGPRGSSGAAEPAACFGGRLRVAGGLDGAAGAGSEGVDTVRSGGSLRSMKASAEDGVRL